MRLEVTKEFVAICYSIVNKRLSDAEWAAVASCDMFQSESFCGGYDAIEGAFCFSYYDMDRCEFWFQVSPTEVRDIINGLKTDLDLRLAALPL